MVQRLKNHFELFGLQPAYALELEQLERAYREIQTRIHPDRFARAGDAERRASMQWTTHVNEAYRILKSPVQRGKYLLSLQGVDVAFESNTAMAADFLVQQMQWREQLEEALERRDAAELERLRARLQGERRALEGRIAERIDGKADAAGAADLVRRLMFLEKFDADIDAGFETIESS
ncbi:MAG: Fe-S protein assembly co-chaperone HscB [Betaproteobacteria bacterium]|nr:MAG: Fe-S protein assembly co-chaperone HscB [Betaproteobacteria bacterium]